MIPKWFIVVPLNEQGIEDCNLGKETENVKVFAFDRNDEYYAILRIGFKVWKQDIFIDEHETTCIEPKDFFIIKEAIKNYDYSKDVPHFLEAMELTEKCNTYLELWL